VIDLPANVTFGPNPDGYRLDQHLDFVRSVQLFKNGPQLIVELWGKTALLTPDGDRIDGAEFQQNSWIDFDASDVTWKVKRLVYADDSHSTDDAQVFELSGSGQTNLRRF
jgi:hypothetical protein